MSLLRTERGIFYLLGEDVNHYTMEHFSTLVVFPPSSQFFLVFLKQQAVWGVSRKLCVNNCTTFCWKPVIRWNGIHPTFDGPALISRNLLTHTPLRPPKNMTVQRWDKEARLQSYMCLWSLQQPCSSIDQNIHTYGAFNAKVLHGDFLFTLLNYSQELCYLHVVFFVQSLHIFVI